MIINKNSKLFDLVEQYPFLEQKLINRNRKIKNTNNLIILDSLDKNIKIEDLAQITADNLSELLEFINNEINNFEG